MLIQLLLCLSKGVALDLYLIFDNTEKIRFMLTSSWFSFISIKIIQPMSLLYNLRSLFWLSLCHHWQLLVAKPGYVKYNCFPCHCVTITLYTCMHYRFLNSVMKCFKHAKYVFYTWYDVSCHMPDKTCSIYRSILYYLIDLSCSLASFVIILLLFFCHYYISVPHVVSIYRSILYYLLDLSCFLTSFVIIILVFFCH